MKIVTDSKSVEEPKNPEECNVFKLYTLFAPPEQQQILHERYEAGGMGYGTAKQALFELLDDFLQPYRQRYNDLLNDKAYIDEILTKGAVKAREIAAATIKRVRQTIGMER